MVSKKQQRQRIIIVVVIGIILLILLQAQFKILPLVTVPVCRGGQVLSIDDVDIRYSNELQKQVIRVVFSTVPTSECLEIQLSPSKIESELAKKGITNFDARNSIIGDITLTKKEKIYNIIERQQDQLFNFDINEIDVSGILDFCTDKECNSNFPSKANNLISSADVSENKCYCVYMNQKGVGGEFLSSTQLEWETDIKIGNNPTLTLSNDNPSGKIGDIAFVKWAGNLGANVDLQSVNRDAWKPFSTNQFVMIDDGSFNILNNMFDSIRKELENCDVFGAINPCEDEVNDAFAYNAEFEQRTSDGIVDWIIAEPLVSDANIISNQLVVILESPIVYPTFTLDIDAEEIGIFVTTGKPQVTCPSSFDIISGQTVTKNLLLKNTAQNSGSFSYELDCNKGSQVLSPSPPQNINSQQTLNIQGTFGLTVEEGTDTTSCTFIAKELNTLEEDSCTFSYDSTKQTQCIEGSKTCENGNRELWTCLADGSFDKQTCKFGCGIVEGEFTCLSQDDEEPLPDCSDCDAYAKSLIFGSFFKSQRCKPKLLHTNTLCSFSILKFALVPIVFIFVSLFGFNFISRLKAIRNQEQGKLIALLLSLIIGGIIAFIVFQLFFLGIILAAGSLIISIFFKRGITIK